MKSLMASKIPCFLLVILSGTLSCLAQEEEKESPPTVPFQWRAELPTGTFIVALGSLKNISIHEYLVNGLGKVTEMTIDSGGSTTARFYAVEPPSVKTPSGLGQSVADRAKEVVGEMRSRIDRSGATNVVVKDYPNTTHAHTVEYLLPSAETVRKLFKNLDKAWAAGRGDKIKVESASK
jgi:hypothetical protein